MKGNEIKVIDGVLLITLKNKKGVVRGYAKASVDDRALIEQITWCLSAQGYAVGKHVPTGRVLKMNRFLFFGAGYNRILLDHRDGDKLNNQRGNLRNANFSGNAQNTVLSKNNSSGAKGVSRTKNGKPWRVRITVNRKEIHIGRFETLAAAASAYAEAARKHHGEFASPYHAVPAVVVAIRSVEGDAA